MFTTRCKKLFAIMLYFLCYYFKDLRLKLYSLINKSIHYSLFWRHVALHRTLLAQQDVFIIVSYLAKQIFEYYRMLLLTVYCCLCCNIYILPTSVNHIFHIARAPFPHSMLICAQLPPCRGHVTGDDHNFKLIFALIRLLFYSSFVLCFVHFSRIISNNNGP